ncbi:MAG: pilus assembly protein PilM [Planctomycetes bacterium]|nr:pilus assembly protein PilM [Planctomycetota bacterium]
MLAGRFTPSIGHVGIDIANGSIKMLQVCQSQGSLTVVGVGEVDMSSGDDYKSNTAHLSDRIKSAFANGRFTSRKCVVCLPPSDIQLNSLYLPGALAEEAIAKAVMIEAVKRFGFDPDKMKIDYICTGAIREESDGRQEILVVAAPHSRINYWLEQVIAAGLKPIAVEPSFSAIARVMSRGSRREDDGPDVRAVVDFASSTTTVMALRGNHIALCKRITSVGQQFDRAVADYLKLDITAAHNLRAARINASAENYDPHPSVDPETDRGVYEAIRPLLSDVVKQIMLCLSSYGSSFRGKSIQRIILTGTEAYEPGLCEALAQGSNLPVMFDEPALGLQSLAKQIRTLSKHQASPATAWASAIGLSLRGLIAKRFNMPNVFARWWGKAA